MGAPKTIDSAARADRVIVHLVETKTLYGGTNYEVEIVEPGGRTSVLLGGTSKEAAVDLFDTIKQLPWITFKE